MPWRKHRLALIAIGSAFALVAVTLVFSALTARACSPGCLSTGNVLSKAGDLALSLNILAMQLVPVIVGVVLGVPLVAREFESGTSSVTWTQAAGRARWLLGEVMSVALALGLAALAVAAVFTWAYAQHRASLSWSPLEFDLYPPAYAGWTLIAFALGVFLGAATRRTLPAVAMTIAGYLALAILTAELWRPRYLPPLHRLSDVQHLQSGGSYAVYWGQQASSLTRPMFLGTTYAWPDGRPLSAADKARSAAWLHAHHIRLLTFYQPGSRYFTFQLIEFGWLTVLAAILIAATVLLARRRPA